MDDNQNNQKRSPLESLQEKLYQPGVEIKGRPEAPEVFQPKETAPERPALEWQEQIETPSQQSMTVKQIRKKNFLRRFTYGFLFLIFIAAAYFGYIYFYATFQKSDLLLKIRGPETAESGENVRFFVSYQNRSGFDLENAILIFEWPQNSAPQGSNVLRIEKRIGVIPSGRESAITFDGQVFGVKNDKLAVSAVLKFTPKGQEKSYETKSVFESIISKTPFSIVMNMPPRAVSGNEIELFLEYQNLSETVFPDMQLKLEYPEEFIFSSAEPTPSFSNNRWDFEKIGGKETGKIKIKGILSGKDNEIRLFQASIGKEEKGEFAGYFSNQVSVVMSSTILFAYQTVNDARESAASLGDVLKYKIIYRNTSDVAIPNVTVSMKIDGKVIDYKSLDIRWGSFSGATNSIIWNASGVPQLALLSPGEEGEVSFSVRLKRSADISGFTDRNFIVSSIAKVESEQIPESLKGIPIGNEDKIDVKVNTAVNFASKGIYKDAPIENSGPIPPKVGQKTTYNIIWQLTNSANDIENGKIEASLPPHVYFEGKISPTGYDIVYEKDTGKIIWNIGKIPAGTGFIMPAMQAAFQISITPGFADVGKPLDLVSDADFGGTDSFTGAALNQKAEQKTTYLLEDSYVIERQGWQVMQ